MKKPISQTEYIKSGMLCKAIYEIDRSGDVVWRAWVWAVQIIFYIVAGLWLFVSGMWCLIEHVSAPSKQAEVEQTQAALQNVDICDTGVRERLISANVEVRSKQRYNAIPFFDLLIPDSWDDMKTVPIENTACYQKTDLKDVNLNVTGLDEVLGLDEKLKKGAQP